MDNVHLGTSYFNMIVDGNGVYTMIPESNCYETSDNVKIDFAILDRPFYLKYCGVLE